MSNSNNRPPDKKFSLEQEMKKRKTQEILRSVETKRTTQTGPLQAPDAKRSTQSTSPAQPANPDIKRASQTMRPATPPTSTGGVKRTTQTARVVQPPAQSARPNPGISTPAFTLTTLHKRLLIASVAGLVLVGVCLALSGLLANNASSGVPNLPFQTTTASGVIQRFIDVGVPISDLKEAQPPSDFPDFWIKAQQKLQFSVTRGDNKGRFILLSYANNADASADAFKISFFKGYKDWRTIDLSNVVFLISPGTPSELTSEMSSHFDQFLLAPALQGYPTATSAPKP